MSDGQVIIEASLDPKGVENEINKMKSNIEKQTSGIARSFDKVGSGLTNKITKPAGIAAGALAGIALAKGWARMTEIDNAKAKLRAVGNTADDVKSIMENATEAVKGTAYGLDSAATASASAVAAGIKPGKELTQYLTNTADAAAVAGTGMSEMGNILNKVTTAGKAYTGDLNQLADRGLPIYQWLGEAAGKSAEKMQKWASQGKISAEMVQEAIQNNIAGAAKEIGSTTITGAISNIGASIGRIGANFLGSADDAESFSGMILPMLNNLMDSLGDVEDKAKKYGSTFAKVIKGIVGYFKNGNSAISKTSGTVKKVLNTIKPVLSVVKKLAAAFSNLGTETKVKLVAGLLLVGPAIKVVSKAMLGLQKINAVAVKGFTALKVAEAGHTGATIANAAAVKKTSIAHVYANAVSKSLATQQKVSTVAVKGTTVAMHAQAAASGVAAVAAKGLNAVMAALGGPVGLVITLVTVAAGAFLSLSAASDENANSIKKQREEIKEFSNTVDQSRKDRKSSIETSQAEARAAEKQIDIITTLADKENKSAAEKATLADAGERLNEITGETVVVYDEQTGSISKTNDELRDYIENVKESAKQEAIKNSLTASYEQQIEAEINLDDTKKTLDTETGKLDKLKEKFEEISGMEFDNLTPLQLDFFKGNFEVQSIIDNIKLQEKTVESATSVFEQALTTYGTVNEEIANLSKMQVSTETFTQVQNELQKMADNAGLQGVKISEDLSRGISAGIYANPIDATQLQSLLDLQPLIDKATAAGRQVPVALQQSILSGEYGEIKSEADFSSLIDLNDLIAKAGNAGKKVMPTIAAQIKANKIKPAEAVKEAQALIDFNGLPKASTAAGKKTIKNLAKEIKDGKSKPSDALKLANDALAKEADIAPKKTAKSFEAIPKAVADRIEKQSGVIKKANNSVLSKGRPKAGSVKSTYSPVGGWAVSGMASGASSNTAFSTAIREIVKDGLAAGEDEAGIASPSKLFRDKIGKYIAQGVGVGITAGTKYSVKAAKNLIKNTKNAVKNVSGNYADIGTNFVEKFTQNLEKGQQKAEKSLEKHLNKRVQKLQKQQQKEEKAVKDKGKKKKLQKEHKAELNLLKKSNNKILKQYKSAYKKQADVIKAQAEKNIQAISDKYQAEYDELISRRDKLKDNLMSIDLGNSFNVTGLREINAGSITGSLKKNNKDLDKYVENLDSIQGKVPDDLFSEILKMDVASANKYIKKLLRMEDDAFSQYITDYQAQQSKIANIKTKQYKNTLIDDLEADNAALAKYSANIAKYKGQIPESLLEEILGMDTETANAFMEALNSMTTTEYNNYVAMWKQKENYATSISSNLVKDDIATLTANYQFEMNAQMTSLSTKMKALGKNVAKGFAKGLKGQKKSVSKVIKDICDQVIKDTKRKFGIKSPSRVMRKIFKQVIQGGEVGTIKEAPKLMKVADQTSDSFIERFQKANLDPEATIARMQRVVQADLAQRPASVTRQIKAYEEGYESKIIKLTIDEGDIYLDGEKVGKKVAKTVDIELGKTVTIKQR